MISKYDEIYMEACEDMVETYGRLGNEIIQEIKEVHVCQY